MQTNLRSQAGPYFGEFGGRFVAEPLIAALDELEATYLAAKADPSFVAELAELHKTYTGRPSIITEAQRFASQFGDLRVFLKREDLNHTGSHKINNVMGQALLAKRMGKKRIIAETGAGQHGVASATAAAYFGLSSTWARLIPNARR
jgi:tryptophan synthase beta chain